MSSQTHQQQRPTAAPSVMLDPRSSCCPRGLRPPLVPGLPLLPSRHRTHAGRDRRPGRPHHAPSTPEIRVLDLFSGAGGLSAGFGAESSRFKTLRAIEHDTAAAATYAENHDPETVFAGGIEDWLKSEETPEADVVIGGPPCQGFSALGKQEQLDERNQLWLRYAETIRKAKPKYFVLENVPQFLTSVQLARFTHHEAARIQGFPDDYKWVGSTCDRWIKHALDHPEEWEQQPAEDQAATVQEVLW